MSVRANQQRVLWEFVESGLAALVDIRNKVGPFHILENEQVYRHLYCRNYERCLDFAANNKWPSFSCENCTHARGTFE